MLEGAAELVELLADRGLTIGTAESLTGGLLAAAITDVPGASRVFRGGVVSYATDVKHDLLGVDGDLLARVGAVDPAVAAAMAAGVCRRLGVDLALATTGVAGPDGQDGQVPGTVWIGLADGRASWSLDASTDPVAGRRAVREATVRTALTAAVRHLRREDPRPGRG
ncbi:CinA family protein [Angustibacter sp. McL0619]|uniref:CinA family protein n=1 Tax=Angustibacter sp. McL0619 TaxID=3415676 RepID=UPI003CF543E2